MLDFQGRYAGCIVRRRRPLSSPRSKRAQILAARPPIRRRLRSVQAEDTQSARQCRLLSGSRKPAALRPDYHVRRRPAAATTGRAPGATSVRSRSGSWPTHHLQYSQLPRRDQPGAEREELAWIDRGVRRRNRSGCAPSGRQPPRYWRTVGEHGCICKRARWCSLDSAALTRRSPRPRRMLALRREIAHPARPRTDNLADARRARLGKSERVLGEHLLDVARDASRGQSLRSLSSDLREPLNGPAGSEEGGALRLRLHGIWSP